MANLTISNRRGPLSVSAINNRYFTDVTGKAVFLSGFHTWATVQDGGTSDPPSVFDWDAYLAALVSYGCNFTKLWAMETTRGWSDGNGYWFTPPRYKRTGPGTDADGKTKMDLTKINDAYIDRLYRRASAAAKYGIYVCVQLFQGWQIEGKGFGGSPFTYHPYASANNINSVSGDQNSNGDGTETHITGVTNTVLSYQESMVTEIVTRLNHLDNVIYEISNEDTASAGNTAWQDYMIDYIHTLEASLPKRHPVGMTWQYPSGANANLTGTSADWVSYGANDSSTITNPPTPSGVCNMFDTDHNGGLIYSWEWVWYSFCRGSGGAWFMDEWDGNYGTDKRNDATNILIRNQLGYIRTLTGLLSDLLGMSSQAALCSTGWCLAKNHATRAEYVCFQDGTGAFTLNLSTATGTLNIRWLRCSDGTVSTDTVSGGATRTLTPPWSGDVVAYVYH